MNFIFFCQSVDQNDPIIGDTISRIQTFAKHPQVQSVEVICLRGENLKFGSNINIYSIQPANRSRLKTLLNLLKALLSICRKKKIHVVYLYMTPTISPIFYLLKPIFNYKVVTWFGHAIYTPVTRISLTYFTDLWLNANKSMAPFQPSHLRLIGQGTDPRIFFPENLPKKYDLVTVGRITEAKKLERILSALKHCKDHFAKTYTLLICGDAYVEKDILYKQKLQQQVKDMGLENQLYFEGSVARDNLRSKLNSCRAFIFASPGGVGKSSVEAMACALPLIISSPDAGDFFTGDLAKNFLCEANPIDIAKKIEETFSRSDQESKRLSEETYCLFKEKYSLDSFVDRAVKAISESFI